MPPAEKGKICDTAVVARKDTLTTSTVMIGLVSRKVTSTCYSTTHPFYASPSGAERNIRWVRPYCHAIGIVWTVFKIWPAINPRPDAQSLAKSTIKAVASDLLSKRSRSKYSFKPSSSYNYFILQLLPNISLDSSPRQCAAL